MPENHNNDAKGQISVQISLTSECEQRVWRPRHVIDHQVERLKVVEERGRLLAHGHGVDDLQSQREPFSEHCCFS